MDVFRRNYICMAEVWLEVHYTISKANLFQPGDYVVIDASGNKDSTVLAYIMNIEMNIGFDKSFQV